MVIGLKSERWSLKEEWYPPGNEILVNRLD